MIEQKIEEKNRHYLCGIYFDSKEEIANFLKTLDKYSPESVLTKELIKDIEDEISLYN